MRLLKEAKDRAIEISKPFRDLAASVKSLAESVHSFGNNLAILAHNQAVHHQMIQQVWANQTNLLRRLGESATDTNMPEISFQKKLGKGQSN
jgi:hypothetical protein